MSAPIPVAVMGSAGRLGSAVLARLAADARFRVVACLTRPESPVRGSRAGLPETLPPHAGDDEPWEGARVLFEASRTEAVAGHAERAAREGVGLVVGVTGLADDAERALERAAGRIPVLVAPNLSLGVAILTRLVREAARALPGWHAEIVEAHHAAKRDSPSGTALWLARALADIRGWEPERVLRPGREGAAGPRPEREIGVHSLRAGTATGEHRVWLGGAGEHLELTHVAENREAFAAGAVEALAWVASASPGRYTMEQAIGGR